jgi:hypothetical protein
VRRILCFLFIPVDEEEYQKPRNPVPIFVGLGGLLLVLVVVGIGVSYLGGGRSADSKKLTLAIASAFVEAVIRNEADILDLDHGWSEDDARKFNKENSTSALYDVKSDGRMESKPGFKHTGELAMEIALHNITLATYASSDDKSIFREAHKRGIRELIRLSIEEIESAGGNKSSTSTPKGMVLKVSPSEFGM